MDEADERTRHEFPSADKSSNEEEEEEEEQFTDYDLGSDDDDDDDESGSYSPSIELGSVEPPDVDSEADNAECMRLFMYGKKMDRVDLNQSFVRLPPQLDDAVKIYSTKQNYVCKHHSFALMVETSFNFSGRHYEFGNGNHKKAEAAVKDHLVIGDMLIEEFLAAKYASLFPDATDPFLQHGPKYTIGPEASVPSSLLSSVYEHYSTGLDMHDIVLRCIDYEHLEKLRVLHGMHKSWWPGTFPSYFGSQLRGRCVTEFSLYCDHVTPGNARRVRILATCVEQIAKQVTAYAYDAVCEIAMGRALGSSYFVGFARKNIDPLQNLTREDIAHEAKKMVSLTDGMMYCHCNDEEEINNMVWEVMRKLYAMSYTQCSSRAPALRSNILRDVGFFGRQ